MWTATIKEKGTGERGTYVDVDFTDGTKVVTERCTPQDLDGLRYWVKGRLATFNCKADLDATYAVGDDALKEIAAPTPDEATLAREEWFRDFYRLERAQRLVDLGIILTTNAKVVALRDKLKANIKPEYIDAL